MGKNIVLTGAPGAGKTTLVEKFSSLGFNIIEEQARKLIAQEQQKPQGILPWTSQDKEFEYFQALLLQRQLTQESLNLTTTYRFLDRSCVDALSFYNLRGMRCPHYQQSIIQQQAQSSYGRIYFLELLDESYYTQDEQRTQTYEEALTLSQLTQETYVSLGLEVTLVPNTLSPQQRVEFILEDLKKVTFKD